MTKTRNKDTFNKLYKINEIITKKHLKVREIFFKIILCYVYIFHI